LRNSAKNTLTSADVIITINVAENFQESQPTAEASRCVNMTLRR